MTTTSTSNIYITVNQILQLSELGCDIIRVAIPDKESALAIEKIKQAISIPLVADIHFDYKLALLAVEAGADKIRINPGNIGNEDKVREIALLCRKKSIPIRVGVNSGSLSKKILNKYNGVTAAALMESALDNIRLLNKFDFDDICISVKTSDVKLTIESYRLMHENTNYPLHIGVTEAGTEYSGIIKSSIGIGTLLADGIGDTIRVSLTASPIEEVKAAKEILKSLKLRGGFDIISCPTCARCKVDLPKLADQIKKHLDKLEKEI
jgi:(E)-4-hydroxy-3-methylbut-2-enyl-diphosphate synthase